MRLFIITFILMVTFTSHAQEGLKSALYYYEQGLALEKLKKYSEGAVQFLKAARLAKDSSELQINSVYKTAYYYNYIDAKDHPDIIRLTLRAVRHVIKSERQDSLAAKLLFRAGIAYKLEYKPDSALLSYNRSKKISEKIFGADSEEVSDCYQCIGDIYNSTYYDYNKSEAYYEQALAIRETKKNDELNLYLVSRLYAQLSTTNRSQRDLEKALAYGLRNIAYSQSLYYSHKSDPSIKAKLSYAKNLTDAYSYVASIYRDMGQYKEAILLYEKATSLNRKMNKERNADLADYYFGWAETLQKEGLLDEAVSKYDNAVDIYNTLILKNINHILCLERLGELYLQKGEPVRSRTLLNKGVDLIYNYNLQKSGQAAGLYKTLGNYFVYTHQYDSALIYYQYSLIASSNNFQSLNFGDNPKLESIELKDYSYATLIQKAEVMNLIFQEKHQVKYLWNALNCFSLAEELLTISRASLDLDNSKWGFFDENFGFYERVISVLHQSDKAIPHDSLTRLAFRYIESSKSKMLEDALNEAEFSDPLIVQDSLIEFLKVQKRNLHALQDQYKNLKGSSLDERKKNIRNSIIETDRKIQLAEQKVNEKYPSYLKIKYRHRVPELNDLKTFARKEEANLLEFFWGNQEIFAMATNGDEVLFKSIGRVDAVQNKIQPFQEFFNQTRNSYSAESLVSFARESNELYKILIEPFNSVLKSKRLIIIPDGPIGQLPFEALTVTAPEGKVNFRNLNYLIKTHAISYSFSASYLLNQSDISVTNPRMLAFGFTGRTMLRSNDENKSNSNVEIAGSEIELQALSKKFPTGRFYFGEEVTERKFKEEASGYDIIHLAVHGKGDTEQNYSASLFFRDPTSSGEDGELHWYELFGMRLKAKLAVISSCESGIGKAYHGEGMLSMANAFAYAGCRNIVMGLWKVDDRVSVELMDIFYRYLQEGKSVDESLFLAKLHYLENSDELTANPKIWASLAAYGNQKVIASGNNIVFYIMSFSLIILLVGVFILLKNRPKASKLSITNNRTTQVF